MDLLALILSLVLAATYLGAGLVKIIRPREKLLQSKNFAWTADRSDGDVKGIGVSEVLGAIGVLAPWYTGILTVLTPIAAMALALLQVFAGLEHARRGEFKQLPGNAVLFLIAAAVAVLRFTQL